MRPTCSENRSPNRPNLAPDGPQGPPAPDGPQGPPRGALDPQNVPKVFPSLLTTAPKEQNI